MHDLTPSQMGSLLFTIKSELEVISDNLAKWRSLGINSNGMVPLSIIAAETKVNAAISDIEDLIQILAKVSSGLHNRY